jgi:hypothetical protein
MLAEYSLLGRNTVVLGKCSVSEQHNASIFRAEE